MTETEPSALDWVDALADPADLAALASLLRDPRSKARHAAAVALAHAGTDGAEVIPLLALELAHPDLEGFFAELAASERDEKILRYAHAAMRFCRERASC